MSCLKIAFVLLAWAHGTAHAFTLISGPSEATLPVSSSNPKIDFVWDGSLPDGIKDKDEFKGGIYEDLGDKEFFVKLLEIAFATWNDVKGSYLEMDVIEDADVDTDQDDLKNSIVVGGGLNAAAAAQALPIVDDDGEFIEDCDIQIGDGKSAAKDLAYTLIHEVGHCVGLGHNHTNYNAVMGYSRTARSLNLGADDKAGLIYLYPDPEYDSATKEFLACASLGTQGSHSKSLLWLLMILPLLIAWKAWWNRHITGLFVSR